MVKLFVLLAGLAAASVQAAPLERRIAQSISAATQKWEQACRAAGGGERCNPISVTAFSTLLAGAGPCEQQDSGDVMIDLAKQLSNDQEMIRLTQIFVQQPRNTPNSIATPYCQKAPKNAELNGLFQCQFEGADQQRFAGGITLGAAGTIPFGLNAPLNPLGSCPANPRGPIADGSQLVDQVENPGAGGNAPAPAPQQPTAAPPASTSTASSEAPTSTSTRATTTAAPAPTQTQGGNGGGNGGFALANAQAAQKLNAKFATLTPESACAAGEVGCVGNAFGQCVEGKFVTIGCPAPAICAALPLVNSAGTSVTCVLRAEAEDRIARAGASGGLTGAAGNDNDGEGQQGGQTGTVTVTTVTVTVTVSPQQTSTRATSSTAAPTGTGAPQETASTSTRATSTAAPTSTAALAPAPTAGNGGAGGLRLANGQAAQALNKQFAGLSANSACQAGENACVNGGFAQCVGGKFAITQCAGGSSCFALPLVNAPGTSITCALEADAEARIAATGATGGITGA